ncbi:hypothetical protein [Clostridium oryzae]|uniref:P68 RBP/TagC-like beta-propeller domain-containing protein n=1 Tax=Clostridium oryzae TaxID=1450648 RepID=A0A1V4IH12_9CLOT|nr:hypothetical protein [Clostridium oryzae]OPJ59281.1 hypothetical protein CLORY_33670 [Clostridium oryzae]
MDKEEQRIEIDKKKYDRFKSLQNYMNPIEFGADSSGKHEARTTEAFKKAVNTGKNLYISNGIYKLNQYILVPYNQKVVVERNVIFQGKYTILYVKDYIDITKIVPRYYSTLKPQGKGCGNVLQGIAIDSRGFLYTTQDEAASNDNVLINKLTLTGQSLANYTVTDCGHGSHIALEEDGDEVYLWTDCYPGDNPHRYGDRLARINMKDMTMQEYDVLPEKYHTILPTMDDENDLIACFALNYDNGSCRVFFYRRADIISGDRTVQFSFEFADAQKAEHQDMQGLAVADNVVYVMTGDNNPNYDKWLYMYDFLGNVIGYTKITAGKSFYVQDGIKKSGIHYEPEGMFFYKNPVTKSKSLIFSIVTGDAYNSKTNPKGRIKRLYSFSNEEDFRFKVPIIENPIERTYDENLNLIPQLQPRILCTQIRYNGSIWTTIPDNSGHPTLMITSIESIVQDNDNKFITLNLDRYYKSALFMCATAGDMLAELGYTATIYFYGGGNASKSQTIKIRKYDGTLIAPNDPSIPINSAINIFMIMADVIE